jgi:methylated-DNA-[protein]-cysteine S-methyltransferase
MPPQDSVVWCFVSSPLGRLWLARSPRGLIRLAFPREEGGLSSEPPPGWHGPPDERDPILCEAARQLRDYFGGRRRGFDLPLDIRQLTAFQERVLNSVSAIPYGEVETYGALARRAGIPQGSRAVGSAVARNPLPILIPCHRVVSSGGQLCGFLGGLDMKRWLLKLEGVDPSRLLSARLQPRLLDLEA